MLQKKDYQQQQRTITPTKKNVTKEEIPTKIPVTPTITNATKEEIPTTTKNTKRIKLPTKN